LIPGFHIPVLFVEIWFCRIDFWYTRNCLETVSSFLPAQTTARMQVEMANTSAKKIERKKTERTRGECGAKPKSGWPKAINERKLRALSRPF